MPNLDQQGASHASRGRKGVLARWLESIAESRMRHVEHEMGFQRTADEPKSPDSEPHTGITKSTDRAA
jgi:hypothetical protein